MGNLNRDILNDIDKFANSLLKIGYVYQGLSLSSLFSKASDDIFGNMSLKEELDSQGSPYESW